MSKICKKIKIKNKKLNFKAHNASQRIVFCVGRLLKIKKGVKGVKEIFNKITMMADRQHGKVVINTAIYESSLKKYNLIGGKIF